MRFAAKMTALITMLLAVSLAVGGYLVMSSSFDARLKGQVRDAQEGVRLLGMTVQALCIQKGSVLCTLNDHTAAGYGFLAMQIGCTL